MTYLIVLLIFFIICLSFIIKSPLQQKLAKYTNIDNYHINKGDIIYSRKITSSLFNDKIIYTLNSILKQYLAKIYNINKLEYNWLLIEKDINDNYFINIDCSILHTKLEVIRRHINIDMSISNNSKICIYKIKQGYNIIDQFIDKEAHHSYNSLTNLIMH